MAVRVLVPTSYAPNNEDDYTSALNPESQIVRLEDQTTEQTDQNFLTVVFSVNILRW